MKLAHPMLNQPIDWENTDVNSFVIENSIMYRRFLIELNEQENGLKGEFVLSEGFDVLDISKHVEIITDLLKIDLCNKKITAGIQKELTDIAIYDKHKEILELYVKINETVSDIILASGGEFVFDELNDISQILKIYNVRPDNEDLLLSEKILMYMGLSERYLHKKIFVFVNFRAYFSTKEFEELLKDITYRKHKVLFVERYDYVSCDKENKRIIDADLCEI